MVKRDFARKFAENANDNGYNMSIDAAEDYMGFLTAALRNVLMEGEKVHLNGVGVLEPVVKKARVCTNPITHEKINVPEKNSVKFKPSKKFIDDLNS